MTQLILDTDIGTDVDDALALAVLLGSPEIDLIGVTTVYGDTLLRARLAKRLARIAQPEITRPFIPGARETLSGRAVWWPGHEGTLCPDLAEEAVDEQIDAVTYLTETVAAQPHSIDVVAIGPLTNIALCLRRDPAFAHNVRRLIIMGGDFSVESRIAEHNFICDSTAAQEVFASGLDITAVGLDVTTRVSLTPAEISQIENAGPLGVFLRAEIEQFWRFHGKPWNNPHDPVAVMTLLRPDLFDHQTAQVAIADSGLVLDQVDMAHPIDIITDLDGPLAIREIVDRIKQAANQ